MATTILEIVSSRTRRVVAFANESLRGDSLSSKVVRNAGWVTVGYGIDLVFRFLSSLILTRLLDPGVYGMIATVTVFLTIASMLSDTGIRPIVQADPRGDDKNFLGTLWTIQIVRGLAISLVMGLIAGAWIWAQHNGIFSPHSMYRDPVLPRLLMVMGPVLLVRGFSSINEFRLLRDLNRGAVVKMDFISRIVTTVVTVALAFLWPTVWAVAFAIVIGGAIRTILSLMMLAGPKMEMRFNRAELKDVLSRSRWVALSSSLTVITMSADKIVIGAYFNLDVLGVYALAYTLFAAANTIVEQMNSGMGVPVLRAIAHKPPEERIRAYYRFRLPIEVYCVTCGLGMVLLGPLLFKLAYDPRYSLGGTILAILGIKLILTPICFSGNFLVAIQRYKLFSIINGIRSFGYLTGLFVAAWMHSIHLAVLAVALERLLEILIYAILPHDSVPFKWNRDGVLVALAAASAAYLMI